VKYEVEFIENFRSRGKVTVSIPGPITKENVRRAIARAYTKQYGSRRKLTIEPVDDAVLTDTALWTVTDLEGNRLGVYVTTLDYSIVEIVNALSRAFGSQQYLEEVRPHWDIDEWVYQSEEVAKWRGYLHEGEWNLEDGYVCTYIFRDEDRDVVIMASNNAIEIEIGPVNILIERGGKVTGKIIPRGS